MGYSPEQARRSVQGFVESYPGLRRLKEELIPRDYERGWVEGFDGRRIVCEEERKVLSIYLQAGEAIIMKQAAVMWNQQLWDMDIPYKMVNFVHDEWEVECYAEHADLIGDIMAESIVQAGKDFNLRCPMAGNKKIGDNWYDVH